MAPKKMPESGSVVSRKGKSTTRPAQTGAVGAGSYRLRLAGSIETMAVRDAITHAGITGGLLRDMREHLGLTIAEVARVLGAGERTVIRKEQDHSALSPTEADRAYRLARIADLAAELIGDGQKAKSWLRTPSTYLGGVTPVSLLDTEVGTEVVVESLYAIAYGGVA